MSTGTGAGFAVLWPLVPVCIMWSIKTLVVAFIGSLTRKEWSTRGGAAGTARRAGAPANLR